MGRPEDDHLLWDWEVVASETRPGPRTYAAWVTQRPDGWYMITDPLTTPQGPYVTKDAAAAARAALREERQ